MKSIEKHFLNLTSTGLSKLPHQLPDTNSHKYIYYYNIKYNMGSHKTLFWVFGLAAKPLSNQNERGLPPIRIE